MKINSKHRVLSIILSVLMVLSLMPVAVFADDGGTIKVGNITYSTFETAVQNAEPIDGVITYTVSGKVDIISTDAWIEVAKSGLTGLTAVKFVGEDVTAELCITNPTSALGDQAYDIDVSFEGLTLSHPNGTWVDDHGHTTNYFACELRNINHADNTVTYTNCTFPNGLCNNRYGKTVIDNCKLNSTKGNYGLWNYGGTVTEAKNSTFTGFRGVKAYTEGTVDAPTIKIENTTFNGMTEKAAIVVSKATDITFDNVTAEACAKGLLQKAIENGGADYTIEANGSGINGTFNISADSSADKVSEEFNITGGTFTSVVPSDYLADGVTIKDNGDGTFGVSEAVNYVAEIGENKYETLAEAVSAANDGETVKLLADATEDVVINKNITLDLGGKTLTNTNAGKATISVQNGATVTVTNGNVVGGTSYYNIEVVKGSNANLTLTGVTATAGNTGSSMIDNWGTLTIESGTYTGGLDTVKNEPAATLSISGGTFTLTKGTKSGFTAVVFNYGTLNISGGEFVQSDKNPPYYQAQVIHTDKDGSDVPSTVITGGIFKNLCSRTQAMAVRATNKAAGATKVSGGTFNKEISDSYCADGFIPTKNADGTYGVKTGKYVAQVGSSTKYETLAEAINKGAKKTVKLLSDVDENVTIKAGTTRTIDLNGYTLNGGTGTSTPTILNLGTLTITDSSADKTGTIKRADSGIEGEISYYVIMNNGTMTIENAIVTNNSGYKKTNPSGSMVGSSLICNEGTDATESAAAKIAVLNIKGGTFTQYNFIAVKNSSNAELNVSGGVINSKHSAVQNWYKANITGGELNGQLWTDAWEETSTGKTVVSGDAKLNGEIVMDITGSIAPTLEISGGSHNVTWKVTTAAAIAGAKPQVSGGTFKAAVPEDYCADGFIPTQNADGTYGVKTGVYVAQNGNEKYVSLQAAIDAAKAGDNVTLIAGVDVTEQIVINKSITLDLSGYTIRNTADIWDKVNSLILIDGGANVTVTGNGTIAAKENDCYTFNVNGNSTLTIENGTFIGNVSVVQVQSGNLVINGGNFSLLQKWNDSSMYLINCIDDAFASGDAKVAIKGGTFADFDPNVSPEKKVDGKTPSFVAEGVGVAKDEGGNFVAVSDMAAQILDADGNSVKAYATLAETFDNVETGYTVRLLKNITLTEQINIVKALNGLTLDGNGYTITCATTADPMQSGGSALYFGNANDRLYCTGIKIKDLTMVGTARYAIFLCGGTSTEFTNVKISGNYYIAVNLYGTHGAVMTNCDISNNNTNKDMYVSAIWSNVSSANPLVLNNTKVSSIAINTYTTANKLEPKIFVNEGSVTEVHTFDDGTVSGNRKLCVSTSSTGEYTILVRDSDNTKWIPIPQYTVTTTVSPAGAGVLTGGGAYEEGTEVTITATANGGYEFLGWYKGSECVSQNAAYTFKASANADFVAMFRGTEKVKLSVNVGAGKVNYKYGDVEGRWSGPAIDQLYSKGTSFTITAVPNAGYKFLYWINAENKVVSEAPEYSFILGDKTGLTACYVEDTGSTEYAYVVFRDTITKDIHWSGDVKLTGGVGSVAVPSMPYYSGYTFAGWFDADGNEFEVNANGNISVTANAIIFAKYVADSELYTVTVDGAALETKYAYGSSVTVTADEMDADGKYFAGWYVGNTCVSMNATYSFIIKSDVVLTTMYLTEKPEPEAVVTITVSERTAVSGTNKVAVATNVAWSLPEGCKLAKAGILYTFNDAYADKLTAENIGDSNIYVSNPSTTAAEGNYGFTISMGPKSAAKNLYVRGYITYVDAAGNIETLYTGASVKSPAGN